MRFSTGDLAGSESNRPSCLSLRARLWSCGRAASPAKSCPKLWADFTFDALRNVTSLINASNGNVLERYHYDAYGKVQVYTSTWTPLTASAYGNIITFTGRELDTETGLYYFRARYFDPSLGRFTARDPLGYVDGLNLYSGYFVPGGLDPSGTDIIHGGVQSGPVIDLPMPSTEPVPLPIDPLPFPIGVFTDEQIEEYLAWKQDMEYLRTMKPHPHIAVDDYSDNYFIESPEETSETA